MDHFYGAYTFIYLFIFFFFIKWAFTFFINKIQCIFLTFAFPAVIVKLL